MSILTLKGAHLRNVLEPAEDPRLYNDTVGHFTGYFNAVVITLEVSDAMLIIKRQ